LRDAYKGAVSEGMHPSAWLKLEMHPARVDVNVHPAKKEVRFQKPHDVRYLITEAVEYALQAKSSFEPEARIVSRMDGHSEPVSSVVAMNRQPLVKQVDTEKDVENVPEPKEAKVVIFPSEKKVLVAGDRQEDLLTEEKEERPEFKLLAELHQTYILMQNEDGLVILDPKAARQRILYEQIMKAEGEVPTQGLLIPEVIELDAFDADVVSRNLDHFNDCGILIEAFGKGAFQVSGLPDFVDVKEPKTFVEQLIDELVATQETKKGKTVAYELFAKKVASKVSRSEATNMQLTNKLLDLLFQCDLPYCDSEGEPTLVQISLAELGRKFGRK